MRAAKNKTSFLSNIFSDVIVSKDGSEISVRCPDCGKPGKSKLCIIVESDVYHCWVCGLKGKGLKNLIKKVNPSKVDDYICNYQSFKQVEKEKESLEIKLPDDFCLLVNGNKNDPDWRAVTKYALSRGFNKSTLWAFRVGYSRTFEWRRRLIITSFDAEGNLNFMTGRSIDKNNSFRYKNESAPRNTIVFNEMDLDFTKPLLIAEGPMDLVKVNMQNKTCLLGSSLNEDSLLFKRIVENNTTVILVLDDDAKQKALKIADKLSEYSIKTFVNFPKPGIDLNDMSKEDIEHLIKTSQQYNYKTKIKLKIGSYKL